VVAPQNLLAILDTNVLYSTKACVSGNVTWFAKGSASWPGVHVSLAIPRVVYDERRYQLKLRTSDLSTSARALDALARVPTTTKPEEWIAQVLAAFDKELAASSVEILDLQPSLVGWTRLIADAAYRRPPFEAGESEKGFRDSILIETFLQRRARAHPREAVVLVGADKLANQVGVERATGDWPATFADLGELKAYLGEAASLLDTEKVKEFRAMADHLLKGASGVRERFRGVLQKEVVDRELEKARYSTRAWRWRWSPTLFSGVRDGRVFFETRVVVDVEAVRSGSFANEDVGDVFLEERPRPNAWGPLATLARIFFATLGANQDEGEPLTRAEVITPMLARLVGELTVDVDWSISEGGHDARIEKRSPGSMTWVLPG
jgi:hypothetical protein